MTERTKPARPHAIRPLRVVVFVFEGISPFFLTFPLRIFQEVGIVEPAARVELAIFGLARGPIRLEAIDPVTLELRHGLDALEHADLVIIPSWHGGDVPVPDALSTALRRAHARGARVVGLCLGVFVLAQCGLLDHRAATVTKKFAHELSARHPQIHLHPGVLYVCEDNVMTSAGRASSMDCCLALVEEYLGIDIADRVADNLVSPPARYGEHAQAVPARSPLPEAERRVLALMDWMQSRLREPLRIDALAAHVHMSPRTLARHFHHVAGTTPKAWLTARRVAYASALLEHSKVSVDTIAEAAGFESTAALRKQFRLAHGIAPLAWREAHAAVPDAA